MSPHFRHRRIPLVVLVGEEAAPGPEDGSVPPSSTSISDTSTGRAPMGTAPGSVVQATQREINAMAAAGQYTDEKRIRAKLLSETSLVLIT